MSLFALSFAHSTTRCSITSAVWLWDMFWYWLASGLVGARGAEPSWPAEKRVPS